MPMVSLAQLPADGEAVHARQHDIQQGDVHAALLRVVFFDGLFPRAGLHDLIARPLEIDHHELADGRLVLANQDLFHRMSPSFPTL